MVCHVMRVESSLINSDGTLTQNIIRETIEVGKNEMDQDRILTHYKLRRRLVHFENS